MSRAAMLLLAAAWGLPGAAEPSDPVPPRVAVSASSDDQVVTVSVILDEPSPEWIADEVEARHPVSIEYQIRLRTRRKAWWDRKLWRGALVARTAFDPVTGRFRCEAVLDGAIVASNDVEAVPAAVDWLVRPPEVRIALPEDVDDRPVQLRARAVFSTSTVWLVFQRSEGTEWSEVPLEVGEADARTDDDG